MSTLNELSAYTAAEIDADREAAAGDIAGLAEIVRSDAAALKRAAARRPPDHIRARDAAHNLHLDAAGALAGTLTLRYSPARDEAAAAAAGKVIVAIRDAAGPAIERAAAAALDARDRLFVAIEQDPSKGARARDARAFIEEAARDAGLAGQTLQETRAALIAGRAEPGADLRAEIAAAARRIGRAATGGANPVDVPQGGR